MCVRTASTVASGSNLHDLRCPETRRVLRLTAAAGERLLAGDVVEEVATVWSTCCMSRAWALGASPVVSETGGSTSFDFVLVEMMDSFDSTWESCVPWCPCTEPLSVEQVEVRLFSVAFMAYAHDQGWSSVEDVDLAESSGQ